MSDERVTLTADQRMLFARWLRQEVAITAEIADQLSNLTGQLGAHTARIKRMEVAAMLIVAKALTSIEDVAIGGEG